MGRSRIEVTVELYDECRWQLATCGVEPLAKEGRTQQGRAYLLGVSGPTVPDARLCRAVFTRRGQDRLTVELEVIEP